VIGPAAPKMDIGNQNNVAGYRDPVVRPTHGEWNLLELVAQGDHVKQFVNGKLANEGSQAFPSGGKILFQSEGAEVFFRNIKLYLLKK
jgi:hypothetical protein